MVGRKLIINATIASPSSAPTMATSRVAPAGEATNPRVVNDEPDSSIASMSEPDPSPQKMPEKATISPSAQTSGSEIRTAGPKGSEDAVSEGTVVDAYEPECGYRPQCDREGLKHDVPLTRTLDRATQLAGCPE